VQAAEATNALVIAGRVYDKTKVDRNIFIELICLADTGCTLVGFVKIGHEAGWTVIDLGGDRQVGYSNSVLVNVIDTARMHVSEALVPNDAEAEGLTGQVVDLPSAIFIQVVDDSDWRSRIDRRRRLRVDRWESTWVAGGTLGMYKAV
jgi:hypothetical protein